MAKTYHKTKLVVSLNEFLSNARTVKFFISSGGKRYKVSKVDNNDEMFFKRIDADQDLDWSFNLNDVFKAYINLNDFATKNFKPFVPIRHSPARGLLLHLGMLE